MTETAKNTDRELWREREGDFYADSIHVSDEGNIGINCGGTVIVKHIRDWHRQAEEITRLEDRVNELEKLRVLGIETVDSLLDKNKALEEANKNITGSLTLCLSQRNSAKDEYMNEVKENKRLREALAWYGDKDNHISSRGRSGFYSTDIELDEGKRARDVLRRRDDEH